MVKKKAQLRRIGADNEIYALDSGNSRYVEWVCGKGPNCYIRSDSKYVSEKHLSIINLEGGYYIFDHDSEYGTYVNDVRIKPHQACPLVIPSIIGVGSYSGQITDEQCLIFLLEPTANVTNTDNKNTSVNNTSKATKNKCPSPEIVEVFSSVKNFHNEEVIQTNNTRTEKVVNASAGQSTNNTNKLNDDVKNVRLQNNVNDNNFSNPEGVADNFQHTEKNKEPTPFSDTNEKVIEISDSDDDLEIVSFAKTIIEEIDCDNEVSVIHNNCENTNKAVVKNVDLPEINLKAKDIKSEDKLLEIKEESDKLESNSQLNHSDNSEGFETDDEGADFVEEFIREVEEYVLKPESERDGIDINELSSPSDVDKNTGESKYKAEKTKNRENKTNNTKINNESRLTKNKVPEVKQEKLSTTTKTTKYKDKDVTGNLRNEKNKSSTAEKIHSDKKNTNNTRVKEELRPTVNKEPLNKKQRLDVNVQTTSTGVTDKGKRNKISDSCLEKGISKGPKITNFDAGKKNLEKGPAFQKFESTQDPYDYEIIRELPALRELFALFTNNKAGLLVQEKKQEMYEKCSLDYKAAPVNRSSKTNEEKQINRMKPEVTGEKPAQSMKICVKKFETHPENKTGVALKESVTFNKSSNVKHLERNEYRGYFLEDQQAQRRISVENGITSYKNVIYQLCSWNTSWLEECKTKGPDILPPSFQKDAIKFVRDRYDNFSQYVGIYIPLLLAELWHTVWERQITRNTTEEVKVKCTYYDTVEVGAGLGRLNCMYVLKTSSEARSPIEKGTLIVVHYEKTNTTKNTGVCSRSNVCYEKVFGYVDDHSLHTINSIEEINHLVSVFSGEYKTHDKLVTLSILIRAVPKNEYFNQKILTISIITNIAAQLSQCLAVCMLNTSPLRSTILSPFWEDLKLRRAVESEKIIFNAPLDENQKELILRLVASCAMRKSNVAVIEGGPGSGKTHIMVAFIIQILLTNLWKDVRPKILYCSHSSLVVDDMALKLKNHINALGLNDKSKLVRYGNIHSIQPQVRDISLHHLGLLAEHMDSVRPEIDNLNEKITRLASELYDAPSGESTRDKSNILQQYVKYRDSLKAVPEFQLGVNPKVETESMILQNADVIFTTCAASGTPRIVNAFEKIKAKSSRQTVICIIDEAMQCRESETIIPLTLGVTHLILIGDSRQLRPRISNELIESKGLNESLFSRIISIFDNDKILSPIYKLKIQYRMSDNIYHNINKIFYNWRLKNGYDNPSKLMMDYLMLIESGENSSSETERETRINKLALNVTNQLLEIMKIQKVTYKIGVVTCRLNQAKVLAEMFTMSFGIAVMDDIEVNPIEMVQGREFDIVLFLFDANMNSNCKANVAMSRAKQCLIILTSHPWYQENELLCLMAADAVATQNIRFITYENDCTFLQSNLINRIK